jgi:hypothetical protein
MAYLETSLFIAKTLWYFDFEAAPGKLGALEEGSQGLVVDETEWKSSSSTTSSLR